MSETLTVLKITVIFVIFQNQQIRFKIAHKHINVLLAYDRAYAVEYPKLKVLNTP